MWIFRTWNEIDVIIFCVAEVGDYDPQDHPAGYVSEFKMLPKQTNKHEDRIAELHKNLVWVLPWSLKIPYLLDSASGNRWRCLSTAIWNPILFVSALLLTSMVQAPIFFQKSFN